MSLQNAHPKTSFGPAQALLLLLPPELVFEILSYVVNSEKQNVSFACRMNTLTNLSLTAPAFRTLILRSPTLWAQVDIEIIHDIWCSPPITFIAELFERSSEVNMSIRITHLGEDCRSFDISDKRWEWAPNATREVRKLLELHSNRIEKLCFEFHYLNGTEYACQRECERGSHPPTTLWRELVHLEMFAAEWDLVHSIPMSWVDSFLANVSPNTLIIDGSGTFRWPVLGKEMHRLEKLQVNTMIRESLALDIVSRTPALEECTFNWITRARSSYNPPHAGIPQSLDGTMLPMLKKLHIGSIREVATPFLSAIITPQLFELRIDSGGGEKKERWDYGAFVRFIESSGLESKLRKLVIGRGVMSVSDMENCRTLFRPMIRVEVVD